MSTPRFTAAELRAAGEFVGRYLSGNELVVRMLAQAAEDAERIETLETELDAIHHIAHIERIEEAITTATLTDVQRILRLSEAIAMLRLELLRGTGPSRLAQRAFNRLLIRAESAERALLQPVTREGEP